MRLHYSLINYILSLKVIYLYPVPRKFNSFPRPSPERELDHKDVDFVLIPPDCVTKINLRLIKLRCQAIFIAALHSTRFLNDFFFSFQAVSWDSSSILRVRTSFTSLINKNFYFLFEVLKL